MEAIEIREDFIPDKKDILKLYEEVQWFTYTENEAMLLAGIKNSLKLITAWDGETLVGLIRVVGDGHSIIYIQDLLVLPSYQSRGIGTRLLWEVLERYRDVYQLVLMTDDSLKNRKFYEKNKLKYTRDYGILTFMK